MTDDLNRFADPQTAIIWLVGLRALSGADEPTCLCSVRYRLIDDGHNLVMSAEDGRGSRYSCIASLPDRMTEAEARRGDFLALVAQKEKLRHQPTAGSA